jgi:hypothetical protein
LDGTTFDVEDEMALLTPFSYMFDKSKQRVATRNTNQDVRRRKYSQERNRVLVCFCFLNLFHKIFAKDDL